MGLVGKETVIEAHVVEGSTPLLLSSKFLYDNNIIIDFKKGQAWFQQWDLKVQLERAPSYHLLLSMLGFPGNEMDLQKLKIPEEDQLRDERGSSGSDGKRPDSQ